MRLVGRYESEGAHERTFAQKGYQPEASYGRAMEDWRTSYCVLIILI